MSTLILDTRQSGAFLLSDSTGVFSSEDVINVVPNPFSEDAALVVTVDRELPEGTVELVNGAYTELKTHTSWVAAAGETTIEFVASLIGMPFEGDITLRITPLAEDPIETTITIEPATGFGVTVIASPSFTAGSVLFGYTGNEPQDGWQIEYTDSPNTTVNPDGTFTQIVVREFDARVWDPTDNTRGEWGTALVPDEIGVIEVNDGAILEASEVFSVVTNQVVAADCSFVKLQAGPFSWTLPINSVIGEFELSCTAPADLPTGLDITLKLYESKTKKQIRELEARIAALETP